MQESQENQGSQDNSNVVIKYTLPGEQPKQMTAQEMMITLDMEVKRAQATLNFATAEREVAQAFQIKCNSLLGGLAEIRWALGHPKVDDEKTMTIDPEKTPLKSIFSDDKQQSVLRVHYIGILELYHGMADQLKIKKQDG